MGKPIGIFIKGHLFLLRTIYVHPPNLHTASTVRMEIYILAIRGVIGPVIQPFCISQSFRRASFYRYCVYIQVGKVSSAECYCLAIRAPSMPKRKILGGCYFLWLPARSRYDRN